MISILILILNHYVKRHLEKNVTFDFSEFFLRLITPLIFAMIAISVISYYAPKQAPIWPDPVPFINHLSRGVGTGGAGAHRQVGYGEDDSRLGEIGRASCRET